MTTIESLLSRREALMGGGLVGAGAVAALLTGCAGGAAASTSGSSIGLEGAWLLDVTLDDGSSGQSLNLYTRDGGVITVTTLPPGAFSPGVGAWARVNDSQFHITFGLFGFDASGLPAGLWRARILATIDQSNDHMTAQSRLEFQPVGSSTFSPRGTERITGSRVKPLPL